MILECGSRPGKANTWRLFMPIRWSMDAHRPRRMRFFRVTPPSVHQMVLALEQAGLIERQPGVARSITVLLDRSDLPTLQPSDAQPVKTTVTRY
jgi:hypothetical protein